jgi:transposase
VTLQGSSAGHFSSAARSGICPHEHQSGKSVRRKARSRRYGPSIVRKLLYLSAMSIRTHSARFRKYFLRKRKEGKPKKLVLNNIANKLLRVLCGMIKNKQPYIEDYQSIHPKHLT